MAQNYGSKLKNIAHALGADANPALEKNISPHQKDVDADSDYDEEELPPALESDFKHKQIFKGWGLFLSASSRISDSTVD